MPGNFLCILKLHQTDRMRKVACALFILALAGCETRQQDEILFHAGLYKLTAADCEHARTNSRNTALSEKELHQKLTREGLMLAHALHHRYDTIETLKKRMEYAMRFYASEVDGYVWNKRVKPDLTVTERDVREAYEKRSKQYHLEVVHFPDEKILGRYCKRGYSVKSKSDFYVLKEETTPDAEVMFYSFLGRYPFYPFSAYLHEIRQAEEGNVWGPVQTRDGFFVLYVAGVSDAQQSSYEHAMSAIRQELTSVLKERFIWESQQNIFKQTTPTIHEQAVREVAARANVNERKWHGVDQGLVLMDYRFKGEDRKCTVADFIEFVHFQPVLLGVLSDPDDVEKMLRTYLISHYLFAEAQEMGAESDEEYLLNKRAARNKIFVNEYKQKHVYPSIGVNADEVAKYFAEHNGDFKSFDSATVSIYRFADLEKASQGRKLILEQSANKSKTNIAKVSAGNPIDMRSVALPKAQVVRLRVKDERYGRDVIDAISKMEIGALSAPLDMDGNYCIIQLSERSGTSLLPLKYAEEQIRDLLSAKKEQEILDRLTEKYPVELDNIIRYLKERDR